MFQSVIEFNQAFGLPIAEAPHLPEQSLRELRKTLLKEELQEFGNAVEAGDRVEMADALADICYIIAGTVICYGIGPNRAEGPFRSPYDEFLPKDEVSAAGMYDLLADCYVEYETAERHDNLTWIDLSLMNMITSVFGVAWRLNIPLNAVFDEVHRSNMSKRLPDGSVLRRDDGKVLKSPDWTPPAIAAILAG